MKAISDVLKEFLVILLAYLNGLKAQKDAQKIDQLEFDLEGVQRVEDVAISRDRNTAITRLRERNRVRD